MRDERTLHYALDDADELMLICAGSRIGALSMVMPDSFVEDAGSAAVRR